ncbi:telomerase-binding protein EST1A-like [Montipora foliosa]|uniref:telomerase-binding protein EST1A-like n=1 Tax=Montipora foliosa TaxID=591990 RepID=UPI0035F0FDB3
MAASSGGKVSPLFLRITYDELVAYADEIDKKRERKHSKKKHHEKTKEKDPKAANQVDKSDSPDASESSNSEKKDKGRDDGDRKKIAKGEEKVTKDHAKKHKSSESKHRGKLANGKENVKAVHSGNNAVTKVNKSNKQKPSENKHGKSFLEHNELSKDETGQEEYDLDLRARTGGVLKFSNSSDGAFEEPKQEFSKPRGIIKLPQGFDFNEKLEDRELLNGNESAERDMLNESTHERYLNRADNYNALTVQRKDEESNIKNEESDFQSSEPTIINDNLSTVEKISVADAHTENCSGYENTENTCKDSKLGYTGNSHAKVEKKVKSLHLQRAQKLLKIVLPKETSLNSLLSRDILDKAAFEKINSLSKEIQEAYKGIMMLDLSFAIHQDVDQNLWRNGFYKIIETMRKYRKLFLGYADQTQVLSPDEISDCLKDFLASAEKFYKNLLDLLQKGYEFSIQDVVNQPRKAENLGKKAKLALLSCHHILICLGDIERYQGQFHANNNWASIRSWYLKANKLAPKNGKPYNQLGVIAVLANRKLDSVYYYIRSLTASNPILTAREKLISIFHDIQNKAERTQMTEDKQKSQSEQKSHQMKGRVPVGRGRGRPLFGDTAKGVGIISELKDNYGRQEVWIFVRHGAFRRVMLTDHDKVLEVNSRGEPASGSVNEEHSGEPSKELPKISLQEVNKKFVLHFLCAHGLLYSRIGMERLPTLQYQLLGEFHTLLDYPAESPVISRSNLLQMTAINIFAISNTASQDSDEQYVRVGTPQDQALNLAIEMFILLLKSCCSLLQSIDFEARNTQDGLSVPLRQFLPAVKVFADWVTHHADLWQASSISTHRILWESVSQFTNALSYVDIDNLHDENGGEVVTLYEDEFLAGFKPLIEASKPLSKIIDVELKALVEDYMRCQCLKDFAAFLVSLENPPLQFDSETGEFSPVIKSTQVSPVKESSSLTMVQLDTSTHEEHEDSEDDGDDVIIESEEELLDSGDEMEKDLKKLKAKKDALKKQVQINKQREDKAKAVIEEHISKPRLMFENYPAYLVPDTNCFVNHLDGLKAIVGCQDFTLVIPLIVINELDGLRKDFHRDKYNDLQHAQYVLENARCAVDFLEYEFSQRNAQVKAVTSKGSELDTIAFRSEDPSGRKGKGNNDDVILSCCLHYCEENFVNRLATANQPITIQRNVVLMTDDRNLRVKAYTRNVPVLTVPQFRKMARL